MGDLFMSLIHTCQLNGVNSFEYLVELLRHAPEVAASLREWMPWCYRDSSRLGVSQIFRYRRAGAHASRKLTLHQPQRGLAGSRSEAPG